MKYCKIKEPCWVYEYMIKYKFTVREMFAVCRKCMYFYDEKEKELVK